MVVSSPNRPPQLTVYGVDPRLWRRFRSWCVGNGIQTGDGVSRALKLVMGEPPTPSDRQEQENG